MKKRFLTMTASILAFAMTLSACGGGGKAVSQSESTGTAAQQSSAPADGNAQNEIFWGTGHEPQAPNAEAVSAKDMLVFRIASDPNSISDVISTSLYTYQINSLVAGTLMNQIGDGQGNVIVDFTDRSLGTSYEMDEDSLGITFHLKEGINFCDGTPFTAEDYIFSLLYHRSSSSYACVDFDNIKALDDYTVYVPFSYTSSSIVRDLGWGIRVFSKNAYEAAGGSAGEANFFTTGFVGTGAYMVDEWVSGDHITLKANPGYFGGTPKIDKIQFRIIAEASVAMMELETGGVDVVLDPSWTDVSNVINGQYGDKIAYWKSKGAMAVELGFNCSEDSKCSDIKIRQAICYAIDKNVFAEGAYQGIGDDMYTIFSGTFENMHDLSAQWPYSYDPEKAKELLKEAGYENGLELTIIHNGDPNRVLGCEIMNKYLGEVGITLNVQGFDTATYAAMMKNETKSWDMWLRNWGGSGTSPTRILAQTIPENCHAENDAAYPAMKELADALIREMDDEKRMEYSDELQERYLTEWLYMYPMVQMNSYTVMNSKLKGATLAEFSWDLTDAYFAE